MDYVHQPLKSSNTEIRIAILQPGAFNDEICISFRNRALTGGTPGYEALSYAWGSHENPSHVQIPSDDRRPLAITRNLDVALKHLRFLHEARNIWVDALCIDQQSIEEKSNQVAIMAEIFASASSTMVWLGPEQDQSNEALVLLKSICQEIEVNWDTVELMPSSTCTDKDWADYFVSLPYRNGELNSIAALFERPYFTRAWIRQELVLSKSVTIYCGYETIPWEDFRKATMCIRAKSCFPEAIRYSRWPSFVTAKRNVYGICRLNRARLILSNLRYHQGVAQCQDPRDRIYSHLGLLNPKDHLLGIKPNYHLSAEQLYCDVAQRLIVKHRKLNFLHICHPASNDLGLPSWVPDWSISPQFIEPTWTQWSSCGWISAQAQANGPELTANGIAKSRIESITILDVCEDDERSVIALGNLRRLTPSTHVDRQSLEYREVLRKYVLLMTNYKITEFYNTRTPFLGGEEYMQLLDLAWSSHEDLLTLANDARGGANFLRFLSDCYNVCTGRNFFTAEGGYVGLGPADIAKYDVICIFLGCDFPIAIRRVPHAQQSMRWRIVGPVLIPGLMRGEAIYRDNLPKHYEAKEMGQQSTICDMIDGHDYALHDTVNDIFIDDPAIILEEAHIKVEEFERDPHILEVLPKSLSDAGIELEEFVII